MQPLKRKNGRHCPWFEIPGFIKDIVGGQQPLTRPKGDLIFLKDISGIVQRFSRTLSPFQHPDNAGDAVQSSDEIGQGSIMGVEEGSALQQILRRIAAQR